MRSPLGDLTPDERARVRRAMKVDAAFQIRRRTFPGNDRLALARRRNFQAQIAFQAMQEKNDAG